LKTIVVFRLLRELVNNF